MNRQLGQARYGTLFRVSEFRFLFAAQALSVAGDQFARVALSVLVFDRTRSSGLTALTYALTYLPDLASGPLLSGIADRHSRKTVMITCDVARALLVAVMAWPGWSLPTVGALLVLVQALGAPFNAARAATLAAVLDGDLFVLGKGVIDQLVQVAQVVGFAVGGVVVTGLGPGQALLVDAATFAASGLLVWLGIRARPRPVAPTETGTTSRWWSDLVAGTRVVWETPRLRWLIGLACVAGAYITVEGLSAPYAAEIGAGSSAVGWLLAASPAGTVLGMYLLGRWVAPDTRLRWMSFLAVAACLPLTFCVFRPGLLTTVFLWALSGAASSYHMPASAEFVRSVPDRHRGQAFGLAATALRAAQGAGILLAGAAADYVSPAVVVAGAGTIGVVTAIAAGWAWNHADRMAPA